MGLLRLFNHADALTGPFVILARKRIDGEETMANTVPEVFIIESLSLDDEDSMRHEGEIISKMLHLSGKTNTKYFYIRTERELEKIIAIFDETEYRYLHISCHSNKTSMDTTFDHVSYAKLGKILKSCLKGRRVFVSACEMANEGLAARLLPGTGCLSLIGPKEDIAFADAAAVWVAFYHLMFKANDRGMSGADIQRCITELSKLYGVPINHFAANKRNMQGFRRV